MIPQSHFWAYTEKTLIQNIHAPQCSQQHYIQEPRLMKATWMYIDRWMNEDVVYTDVYNGILLSYKKNEIMPFAATWMDPEIIILSEVNQRNTNIKWYHIHVESKKMIQMNLFTRQTHRQKTNLKGKQGGKIKEFEISKYKLLYIKQINNKDLLYSTGNYIQYLKYNEKES